MENIYIDKNISTLPKISVLLVCGIPGVGKSFFCEFLVNLMKDKFTKVFYLNFDYIFYQLSLKDKKFELDFSKFKFSRIEFFNNFKNICKEIVDNNFNHSNENYNLIILDDNFYIKSMKKPFYKFCKQNYKNCSYLEVHLKCTLDYAFNMNSLRKDHNYIPENVINKMYQNFQWDSFNNKFILEYDIENKKSIFHFNFELLLNKLIANTKILQIKNELDDKFKYSKKEKKALFLDIVEIKLRKTISEMIKDYLAQNSEKIKISYAKSLSNYKKIFISYIKSLLYKSSNLINIQLPVDHFKIQLIIESVRNQNYEIIEDSDLLINLLDEFKSSYKIKYDN